MINRLTKSNTSTTSRRFLPRKEEMLPWLSSADRRKKQRPYSCKLDSHTGQYRWILTSSIGTGTQHAIYSYVDICCQILFNFKVCTGFEAVWLLEKFKENSRDCIGDQLFNVSCCKTKEVILSVEVKNDLQIHLIILLLNCFLQNSSQCCYMSFPKFYWIQKKQEKFSHTR